MTQLQEVAGMVTLELQRNGNEFIMGQPGTWETVVIRDGIWYCPDYDDRPCKSLTYAMYKAFALLSGDTTRKVISNWDQIWTASKHHSDLNSLISTFQQSIEYHLKTTPTPTINRDTGRIPG